MAMIPRQWRALLTVLLVVTIGSLAASAQTTGLQAQVLTNDGRTLSGELSGLVSPIRLLAGELARSVGPDRAYEVPLPLIRQITIDFPRVIVETADRVLIGPFSAFRGIAELLTLQHAGESVDLPTAAVRAIALNGEALHPVPHEWLGNQFLTHPAVLGLEGAATTSTQEAASAVTPPSSLATTYEQLYQVPPTETPAETPWWLVVLVLGAVVVAVYFLFGTGST